MKFFISCIVSPSFIVRKLWACKDYKMKNLVKSIEINANPRITVVAVFNFRKL